MLTRVVEIGNPAKLRLADRALEVERADQPLVRIPLEDLGLLLIDHPQVTLTHALVQACAAAGTAIISCDAKHLPCAALVPFAGHSLHAKVVQAQADASLPSRKRLWQTVVRAKIRAQADCLLICRQHAGGLPNLIDQVRSGDPENVEAQAAQRYWRQLFGDDFRRDQDGEGINALLNYGYAILRSAIARAAVGSGLHPGLGLHHCNQYNAYALADDLMEPLRPAVDRLVFDLCRDSIVPALDRPTKALLISLTASDCRVDDQRLPFFAALPRYTASIARVLLGDEDGVVIPLPVD